MKRKLVGFLFITLIPLSMMGVSILGRNSTSQMPGNIILAAANTPTAEVVPTQAQVIDVSPTPEERILPPVGENAGLVLGASVLVLIIIGGVVFISRRKPKH